MICYNRVICLSNVKKVYKKDQIINVVLKGINMTVKQGEMLCIMGVSGSGKSTLLNIIAGLTTLTEGVYYYQNNRLDLDNYYVMEKFRHDKIGVILQRFALIEDLSVYENIALPLKYQKVSSKEIKRRVLDVMEELGLTDKKNFYPEELSGGQQQRVAIARALIKQPEIVIADEPTGALDEENTKKVLNILKKMNQRGITLIIATHDKNISDICDRTLFLKDGVLEEEGFR